MVSHGLFVTRSKRMELINLLCRSRTEPQKLRNISVSNVVAVREKIDHHVLMSHLRRPLVASIRLSLADRSGEDADKAWVNGVATPHRKGDKQLRRGTQNSEEIQPEFFRRWSNC